MPWFRHNENAGRFAAEMAALGFVGERAWMDWGATPEGRRLIGDPAEIATATVDQLHKLVTAAVRGDRFVEGNLAAALETGKLLAIVRRARELADAEETGLDR